MLTKGDHDVAKPKAKPPAPDDVVRFGLYVTRASRTAIRQAALAEGVSATKLVEDLIRKYLATHRKASRKG